MRQVYQTDRLLLELTRPGLAGKVAAYFVRNREFLSPTEPFHPQQFYTKSHQRMALRQVARRQKNGLEARFWVMPKNGPDKVIGTVAVNNIVYGAFRSAFLSYRLDKDYLGRGLMPEAVGRIVAVAFGELGLHRLEANIMPRNHASIRVVEKLGFALEGRSPKYLCINGVWEDHIHMVLLNENPGTTP